MKLKIFLAVITLSAIVLSGKKQEIKRRYLTGLIVTSLVNDRSCLLPNIQKTIHIDVVRRDKIFFDHDNTSAFQQQLSLVLHDKFD